MILTFDCYGTLLDTTPIKQLLMQLARKCKRNEKTVVNTYSSFEDRLMYGETIVPYENLIQRDLEYLDMIFGTALFFQKQAKLVVQAYHQLRLFPEVMSVLQQLKEKQHTLLLMSNASIDIMADNAATLGYLFDDIFLPEQTGCYKPTLAFFQYVDHQIGHSTKQHVHIAKGFWWDIVPCTKMGWQKVWINREHLNGMTRYQPYQIFNDLTPVPAYIANIAAQDLSD